jgi:hypothetical protein
MIDRGSAGRFGYQGKPRGQLRIGPTVKMIQGDGWPLITLTIIDGDQSASLDISVDAAPAIITEMQQIIREYGNGSDVPPSWDVDI